MIHLMRVVVISPGYGRCKFSLRGKASSPTKQYRAFCSYAWKEITMRQIECIVLEDISECRIIENS